MHRHGAWSAPMGARVVHNADLEAIFAYARVELADSVRLDRWAGRTSPWQKQSNFAYEF